MNFHITFKVKVFFFFGFFLVYIFAYISALVVVYV